MSDSDKHVRDSEYIAGRLLECRRFVEEGRYITAAEILQRAASFLEVAALKKCFEEQEDVI